MISFLSSREQFITTNGVIDNYKQPQRGKGDYTDTGAHLLFLFSEWNHIIVPFEAGLTWIIQMNVVAKEKAPPATPSRPTR
jgi:hypothetical protein